MPSKYKNIQGWFDFEDVYDEMIEKGNIEDIFVEVGSWKGQSACYMLEKLEEQCKEICFVCVDSWTGDEYGKSDDLYSDVETFTNNLKEQGFDVLSFDNYNNMVGTYALPSDSSFAAKSFEDESVQFVFIDANHYWEKVLEDLNCWWEKVKPGGYLGGHDYPDPNIKRALQIFNKDKGLPIRGILNKDNIYSSFLIEKNG